MTTSTMTYDMANQLLSVTEPERNQASYAYDLTCRPLDHVDPDQDGRR